MMGVQCQEQNNQAQKIARHNKLGSEAQTRYIAFINSEDGIYGNDNKKELQ